MVSAPSWLLARVTASRSDSRPSPGSTTSSGVVTVKVAGTRRFSRHSRLGRNERDGRFFMAGSAARAAVGVKAGASARGWPPGAWARAGQGGRGSPSSSPRTRWYDRLGYRAAGKWAGNLAGHGRPARHCPPRRLLLEGADVDDQAAV